jgi:hypothetical protein
VTSTSDDERRGRTQGGTCPECAAARAPDQRYCVSCGARLGSLPAPIAALVRRVAGAAGSVATVAGAVAAAKGPKPTGAEGGTDGWPFKRSSFMPSPRAAAAAVIVMMALGVAIGSATDQIAQSAGLSTILLESPPPPEEPAPQPSSAPGAEAAGGEAAAEPAPEPIAEAPLSTASVPTEEPLPETEEPIEPPPELPAEEGLPEIKHVFLIILGDNGFEEAFGPASTAPYLARKLPKQGELLTNYFAVAQGDLANEIALLSGQGPTPETAANCPSYGDVTAAGNSAEGQVEGSGCVYPATTETLPGQLAAAGLEWRAYVEDIGNGAASGQPPTCRHPALGAPDPSQAPIPGDAYETWRNPFVYFHSILDSPECEANDVGLDRLPVDLRAAKRTPALSYIVPNACHSGGEMACEPGRPIGAAAADEFLGKVVPAILASPAYQEGGLIAITSAQAPQSGEKADPSSCCIAPLYPNLPPPDAAGEPASGPVKPTGGGGRVGMLLLSSFVEAGSVNESTYANHYTLLLTLEELFGLEKLGYANEIALLPFDSAVFNAAAE